MCKHPLLRIALALALILWPLSAMAAPPPAVRGVTAALENGKLHVRWQAPSDPSVVAYRVYWSHVSIIDNGGAYDDFESTTGTQTDFIFPVLPPVSRVSVAVLAVNDRGEESRNFGDEATIDLPATPGQNVGATVTAPSTASATQGQVFRLLSARMLSRTGALLTFSEQVAVSQAEAATAFQLTDDRGAILPIRTIIVRGPFVTIVTDNLQQGTPYTVTASAVHAIANPAAALDPGASSITFASDGTASPTTTDEGGTTPVVANVRMSIEGKTGATYTVAATFDVPSGAGNLAQIDVYQSRDGGRSFGAPQTLPPQARSVRFTDVPPGDFAILLRARGIDGNTSGSIPASIHVGAAGARTPLTSSGAGLGAILVASGAVMGWRKMKR